MVFHPFLLAAYPILALMGQNAGEVRVASLGKLIGLVLVATLAIWLLLGIVLRDLRKSGVAASLATVLFFTSDLVLAPPKCRFLTPAVTGYARTSNLAWRRRRSLKSSSWPGRPTH